MACEPALGPGLQRVVRRTPVPAGLGLHTQPAAEAAAVPGVQSLGSGCVPLVARADPARVCWSLHAKADGLARQAKCRQPGSAASAVLPDFTLERVLLRSILANEAAGCASALVEHVETLRHQRRLVMPCHLGLEGCVLITGKMVLLAELIHTLSASFKVTAVSWVLTHARLNGESLSPPLHIRAH